METRLSRRVKRANQDQANEVRNLAVKPLHDIIYYSDHALIPQLFGSTWYLAEAIYAFCFLAFLFSVVAVAGVFELEASTFKERGIAGQAQPAQARPTVPRTRLRRDSR